MGYIKENPAPKQLRGFDVTALGHYDDKESIPFKLGDDLTLAFVNKKANMPQMTMIKNVSKSSLEKRLRWQEGI